MSSKPWSNKTGIPSVIANAVIDEMNKYDPGDAKYSTTTLLNPPRQVQLVRRHAESIERDVADYMFAFYGSAIHASIENAAMSEYGDVAQNIEERVYARIGDVLIGGKPDLVINGTLIDWKFMSVWEAINGLRAEKEQQANINAWLLKMNGYTVERNQIFSMYRDWAKTRVSPDPEDTYPKKQAEIHELPMWSEEDALAFIQERVRLHEEASHLPDDELPFCTPHELWADGKPWAIMIYKGTKPALKRAVKLFTTREEAERWVLNQEPRMNGQRYVLERRALTPRRCEFYCAAAPFCNQWQDWKAKHADKMVIEHFEIQQPEPRTVAKWMR